MTAEGAVSMVKVPAPGRRSAEPAMELVARMTAAARMRLIERI